MKQPSLFWASLALFILSHVSSSFAVDSDVKDVIENASSEQLSQSIAETPKNECVILLHGLGRSAMSMKYVEHGLEESGYFVVNHSYPSFEQGIERLAEQAIDKSLEDCVNAGISKVSFVTHSMGGILVRSYLQNKSIAGLQRVVMLAPPNHGSELVSKAIELSPEMMEHPLSFRELDSHENSYVNQLKAVHSEIGVIAGSVSINPLFSGWLTGEDDSKVSVTSACLPEMRQLLIYPVNHTMITFNANIMEQINHFLVAGLFKPTVKGKIVNECHQLAPINVS